MSLCPICHQKTIKFNEFCNKCDICYITFQINKFDKNKTNIDIYNFIYLLIDNKNIIEDFFIVLNNKMTNDLLNIIKYFNNSLMKLSLKTIIIQIIKKNEMIKYNELLYNNRLISAIIDDLKIIIKNVDKYYITELDKIIKLNNINRLIFKNMNIQSLLEDYKNYIYEEYKLYSKYIYDNDDNKQNLINELNYLLDNNISLVYNDILKNQIDKLKLSSNNEELIKQLENNLNNKELFNDSSFKLKIKSLKSKISKSSKGGIGSESSSIDEDHIINNNNYNKFNINESDLPISSEMNNSDFFILFKDKYDHDYIEGKDNRLLIINKLLDNSIISNLDTYNNQSGESVNSLRSNDEFNYKIINEIINNEYDNIISIPNLYNLIIDYYIYKKNISSKKNIMNSNYIRYDLDNYKDYNNKYYKYIFIIYLLNLINELKGNTFELPENNIINFKTNNNIDNFFNSKNPIDIDKLLNFRYNYIFIQDENNKYKLLFNFYDVFLYRLNLYNYYLLYIKELFNDDNKKYNLIIYYNEVNDDNTYINKQKIFNINDFKRYDPNLNESSDNKDYNDCIKMFLLEYAFNLLNYDIYKINDIINKIKNNKEEDLINLLNKFIIIKKYNKYKNQIINIFSDELITFYKDEILDFNHLYNSVFFQKIISFINFDFNDISYINSIKNLGFTLMTNIHPIYPNRNDNIYFILYILNKSLNDDNKNYQILLLCIKHLINIDNKNIDIFKIIYYLYILIYKNLSLRNKIKSLLNNTDLIKNNLNYYINNFNNIINLIKKDIEIVYEDINDGFNNFYEQLKLEPKKINFQLQQSLSINNRYYIYINNSIASLFIRYIIDNNFNFNNNSYINNIHLIKKDDGTFEEIPCPGVDYGGLLRNFITSLCDELFTKNIFIKYNQKYYINPLYEIDEEFDYLLKKNNIILSSFVFINKFYNLIGHILFFILTNNCGLNYELSYSILNLMTFNNDNYINIYFMLLEYKGFNKKLESVNVFEESGLDITYNDEYYLIDEDKKIKTKEDFLKYLYIFSNTFMTKNIKSIEELRNDIKFMNKVLLKHDNSFEELNNNYNYNRFISKYKSKYNKNLELECIKEIINDGFNMYNNIALILKHKISLLNKDDLTLVNINYNISNDISLEIIDKLIENIKRNNLSIPNIIKQFEEIILFETKSKITNPLLKLKKLFSSSKKINKKSSSDLYKHFQLIKDLLYFWSGSTYFDDTQKYTIEIKNNIPFEHFPTSHTCFHIIELPKQTSNEGKKYNIKEKLLKSLELQGNYMGFAGGSKKRKKH